MSGDRRGLRPFLTTEVSGRGRKLRVRSHVYGSVRGEPTRRIYLVHSPARFGQPLGIHERQPTRAEKTVRAFETR
jgi:hypothetical protein